MNNQADQVTPTVPVYVDFLFYRLEPAFRRLPKAEKQEGVEEFIACVERHTKKIKVKPYLTIGLRADADLLLWAIADDLEPIQEMVTEIYTTGLGRYLTLAYSYLALRRPTLYAESHQQAFELDLPSRRYLFVYPFVKSREWYHLSLEARRGMMNEHINVGHQYPAIRLNTTYSFGLGDQDFVLAFEADSPAEFEDLVQRLRETEVSRYTVRDTPMIVCAARGLRETVAGLGL